MTSLRCRSRPSSGEKLSVEDIRFLDNQPGAIPDAEAEGIHGTCGAEKEMLRLVREGGLPPETAYTLSDRYYQAVEKSSSMQTIIDINYAMQEDFVQRVHQFRKVYGMSPTEYWERLDALEFQAATS